MILTLDTSPLALLAYEPPGEAAPPDDPEFDTVFDRRSPEREPRDDAGGPGWVPVQPALARYAMPGSAGLSDAGLAADRPSSNDASVEGAHGRVSAAFPGYSGDPAEAGAAPAGISAPSSTPSDGEQGVSTSPPGTATIGDPAQGEAVILAILDTGSNPATPGDPLSATGAAVGSAAVLTMQAQIWNAARRGENGAATIAAKAQSAAGIPVQVTVIRAGQPGGTLAERMAHGAKDIAAEELSPAETALAQDDGSGVGQDAPARGAVPKILAAGSGLAGLAGLAQGRSLESALLAGQLDDMAGAVPVAGAGPAGHAPAAPAGGVTGSAGVPGQVVATLVAAAQGVAGTADRVEVLLSPEELGRVQLDFRSESGGMRVILTAERPDTLDLLRRHADQLLAELRDAGYSGASLSFGQWGQSQAGADDGSRSSNTLRAEQRDPSPAHPPYRPAEMTRQGLDLRI